MSIRLALVEDDQNIQDLAAKILSAEDEFSLNLVCDDGSALLDADLSNIDVAIVDIGLPDIPGTEVVYEAKLKYPGIEFIMFTQSIIKDDIFGALQSGATGYIKKSSTIDELISAIKEVYLGGSPMSREIARLVATSFKKTESKYPELEKLSPQELEVLNGLDKGLAYKQIANSLFVTENTVKTHVRHIYEKLQVHSRHEALNKWNNK